MTPEQYVAGLQALSDWMRPLGLAIAPSLDGESVMLIRDIDGAGEVLAITRSLGDTLAEGELLREQAEGLRAIRRAGLVPMFRLRQARFWEPGEMALYEGEEVVFRAVGHPDWNSVVRAAWRWVAGRQVEAKLLTGAVEA